MQLIVPAPDYALEFAAREHAPPLSTRFAVACNCGRATCLIEEGGDFYDLIESEFGLASNAEPNGGGWMDAGRDPVRARVWGGVLIVVF
jgi:hypothetical protein